MRRKVSLQQDKADALDLAKKIVAGEDLPASYQTPQKIDWEETQAILYARANIKKPNPHRMAPAEATIRGLDFSEMSEKDYKDNLSRTLQTGAVASLRAVRNIKDLADTVHLLGHTVRGLQDQVS